LAEPEKRTRVLIVDDHAIIRAGVRAVLQAEDDMEVVGEAATTQEAIDRARALKPDAILMDVRLGEGNDAGGVDACREIRSELADVQVVMFSSFGERESVLASIMAGAAGFLTKNVGPDQIVEAIRTARKGESILDPRVTRNVVERLTELTKAAPEPGHLLSDREREVLLLVTQGLTNKEIAARLYVSPYTARNHVIRILDKLGLSSRTEAAAEAVRLGLLDDR